MLQTPEYHKLLALGGNLRRRRTAKGYTQEAVADAARISVAAYRNYETGRAIPKVNTLLAIARALGVSFSDLITEARPLTAVRFRTASPSTTSSPRRAPSQRGKYAAGRG